MASNGDEFHEDKEKMQHDGWDDIKELPRRCTDCTFLLALIGAWFSMTVIGFIVCGVVEDSHLQPGNPERLFNPIDYEGNICGVGDGLDRLGKGYYLPDRTVVCVSSCPKYANFESFYCHYDLQASADLSVTTGYTFVNQQRCMYQIETREFVNRCFPDMNTAAALLAAQSVANSSSVDLSDNSVYTTASSGKTWFAEMMADVITLQAYIFGFGFGVSTFLAFLYLYVLRIPGLLGTLIWSMLLSVLVVLLVGSILLYVLSQNWKDDEDREGSEATGMLILAYIGFIFTGLYFCFLVVMRKRVQLAINVVKETSKAFTAMPLLILMPLVQVLGIACFLPVWLTYVVYLASSGELTVETTSYTAPDGSSASYQTRSFEYTENTYWAFLYLLFCWFWTSEFIIAVGQMVLALAVVRWYFVRNKDSIGNGNILWAAKTVGRYHLGTCAFGSLIIAVIKTIRAIIAYIQKKAKKSGNKVAQYILCLLQCFMWCLEKCMKFLNSHAYILTAVYGYAFCTAARRAFFLLLRNILRVSAVNMVSSFVLFLGKLCITLLSTFFCYLALQSGSEENNVNGWVLPLIFTFLLAYFVACIFAEVMGMAIKTVLICYIADEEMFENPGDRFASGSLMTTIQKAQIAKAEANKSAMKVVPLNAQPVAVKAKELPPNAAAQKAAQAEGDVLI